MRRMLLALTCTLFASACGPEFAVVPRGGIDRVVAQGQGPANGVTIVAFANQWDAYPFDLADYVTPIAVELYNPGPNEVRVSYVDLALRDSSGFRYAAINPYIPATAVGENDAGKLPDDAVLLAANGPMIVASNHSGFHGGGGGAHFGGGHVVGPPPSTRSGGGYYGGGRAIIPPPRGGVIVGPPGVGMRRPGVGWGYSGGR